MMEVGNCGVKMSDKIVLLPQNLLHLDQQSKQFAQLKPLYAPRSFIYTEPPSSVEELVDEVLEFGFDAEQAYRNMESYGYTDAIINNHVFQSLYGFDDDDLDEITFTEDDFLKFQIIKFLVLEADVEFIDLFEDEEGETWIRRVFSPRDGVIEVKEEGTEEIVEEEELSEAYPQWEHNLSMEDSEEEVFEGSATTQAAKNYLEKSRIKWLKGRFTDGHQHPFVHKLGHPLIKDAQRFVVEANRLMILGEEPSKKEYEQYWLPRFKGLVLLLQKIQDEY